jgi:oligopeptide/dipeptide ABC transporter ATP-binding protein
MHVVFQDPFTSLNPRMPIGKIVIGPLVHHRLVRRRDRRERAAQLLELVGLGSRYIDRYPHSLSGGQRQRVAIARALSADPLLLIADEPISALDASIQAAMLNLLLELQAKLGFACLFITHDLSAARLVADWVAVMYLGQVVEHASSEEVFSSPRHPYTQALLSAVPLPDPRRQRERQPIILAGDPPSPLDPPTGCRFHGRCPIAVEVCHEVEPGLVDPLDRGHLARCHLVGPGGEAPSLAPGDGAPTVAPVDVFDPVGSP